SAAPGSPRGSTMAAGMGVLETAACPRVPAPRGGPRGLSRRVRVSGRRLRRLPAAVDSALRGRRSCGRTHRLVARATELRSFAAPSPGIALARSGAAVRRRSLPLWPDRPLGRDLEDYVAYGQSAGRL